MRKLGKVTDSVVLREVLMNPGATVSSIAENLGWSNGKVDGSVNRLIREKKVEVKHFLQRGTLLKRVYPKEYLEKPKNTIEIPREMISDRLWTNNAFVYALSRSTIGVAARKNEEWASRAFVSELANLRRKQDGVVITFPDKLTNFYQLENSETSLSTVGDLAMVTVESILPVRLPSAYPERSNLPMMMTFKLKMEQEQMVSGCADEFFIYMRKGISAKISLPSCSNYVDLKKSDEEIVTVTNANVQPLKESITLLAVTR